MADPSLEYAVEASMASDVGRVRGVNQDTVALVSPGDPEEHRRRGMLAVVADGMGGHRGGEVASAMAVEVICRHYFAAAADDPLAALEQALLAANATIHAASMADPALAGMGTTATALALVGDCALVAHVGDTRLYRCSQSQAVQMTEDDTLVDELKNRGLISAEEARHHPDRSVLLRSLGTRADVSVAKQRLAPLRVGECFVLCSDGLHDSVEPFEIAQMVNAFSPEAACRQLIELARKRDGSDNISVGVIAIRPPEAADRQPPVTRETLCPGAEETPP